MSDNAHDKFNHDTERYFESTRSYVATEQIVACIPITISVFIISITLFYMSPASAIQVGVLVAVLPRSLQLLGNVHSLSIYLSQFVMIGQKIKNLESFTESLERQVFTDQIHPKDIVTTNTANGLAVEQTELLALIKNNGSTGRYLISGPNGSGKSTLLQLIKSKTESCILVTPGAYFSQQADSHSTGQLMLAELSVLLHEPSAVLLLDEWDANLDAANIQIINDKVQKISEKKLIIEVRHRNFQRAITPQSLGSV